MASFIIMYRMPVGAAFSVWQCFHAAGAAILIDGGNDAETLQHALDSRQVAEVDLCQPDADTFFLRALHRTIGVEHAAQYTAIEAG